MPEAEVLAGLDDRNRRGRPASRGGDLRPRPPLRRRQGRPPRDAPIDIVFDGRDYVELPSAWVETTNTHGTGCTFSAAIAAYLARGAAPIEAIAAAKDYVTDALQSSYRIGNGHSPVNHFQRDPPGRSIACRPA